MTKGYGVSSKEGNTIKLNGDTIFRSEVYPVFAVAMLMLEVGTKSCDFRHDGHPHPCMVCEKMPCFIIMP